MKFVVGLVLLVSANAFAANNVYKVVVESKTVISYGGVGQTINTAVPVEVALKSGYGEYLEQQQINGRTLYRTLVVSGADSANCSLTATVVWSNGDSATGVTSCATLVAKKSVTESVADADGGRNYVTSYTIYSEQ